MYYFLGSLLKSAYLYNKAGVFLKIKFMADSASDISRNDAEIHNIEILPILIRMDGKFYRDFYDFTPHEYYRYLYGNWETLPTTSLVTPEKFLESFEKAYSDGYDGIIFSALNSRASGTYQSSEIAKKLFFETKRDREFKIEVIDSGLYAFLIGAVVIMGTKMHAAGTPYDEIVSFMRARFKRMRAYAVVYTLDFLKRTGRIDGIASVVGKMLDIKPLIFIGDGTLCSSDKVRGRRKSLQRMVDLVKRDIDEAADTLYIIRGDMDEETNEVVEMLKNELPGLKFEYSNIGSVIATHSGPNLLGIAFYRREDCEIPETGVNE